MIRSGISITLLCFVLNAGLAQCLSGDCQNGHSTYKFQNGALYEGEMAYGKIHGLGTLRFANGDVYIGYWKSNKREGEGILNGIDGLSYQGTFYNNQLHGTARVYDTEGGYFEGLWEKGVNTTGGAYVHSDGRRQKGYWTATGFKEKKDQSQASTVEYLADCNLVPCGSGRGRMVFDDGSVYTGFFLNGLPDGEVNIPLPVLRNMEMFSLERFTVARSGCPSRLKSFATRACSLATGISGAGVKIKLPLPSLIEID